MTSGTLINKETVTNFNGLIDDIQRETGRSADEALKYAGGKFLNSCSASAKPGMKLRKVIANPLFKPSDDSADSRKAASKAKGDMRRARFGVMKYAQKKEPKFVPIYRTGEYGRIRFIDKKTGQMRWRSTKGTLIKETNFEQGFESAPSIKNSKRRIIKNAGLARKIFRIMRASVLSGGRLTMVRGEHFNIDQFFQRNASKNLIILRMHNALSYITNAYPNILQSSMAAAQKGLEYELKNQISKRTAQAINRRRAA